MIVKLCKRNCTHHISDQVSIATETYHLQSVADDRLINWGGNPTNHGPVAVFMTPADARAFAEAHDHEACW